ncbi:polyhydroxyalkanoic acid system family protein [Sorangium atrum]|uniref:Polyhydroxyalkanoic acid system family protein n=1 Tax=Sorangium atrum TaxID=2995308 RepID=A0ABT5CC79_9BACT|nr:polyhydroxyalkanoic acid system family protein [Sorangium aterium]MDC0684049.1 polyhydroxyalkanoic acid system family protein [Sorangium aterium]
MKHTIEHDLSDSEAKLATERAIAQYRERYAEYEPFLVWRDPRRAELGFSVKGVKLKGSMELRPGAVDVDLDVPLLMRPFKGVAIAAIDKEVRHFIEEAHRERAQGGGKAT